jgi:PAS domain S-box-containing protein
LLHNLDQKVGNEKSKSIKMKSVVFPLRRWLSTIPIKDLVERRMASLVQVILLGFMAIILIATILNLLIAPEIPWQMIVIRSGVVILVIGVPLLLLRRGHFRSSVLIIIGLFFILETFAVTTTTLGETTETLLFFTLTIILAGLLLGRRALVITYTLSVGVILIRALREQNATLRLESIVIASNFVLLNGLIALFLDQFGVTLRTALVSASERENELQNEVIERKRIEQNLERRVAELVALYQSGIAFSQLFDQKEIAEKVIEVLRVHLDWHHAAVRIRRGETNELELLAFSHSEHLHEVDPRLLSIVTTTKQGLVGWVIEHGQALRVANVKEDPRYIETYPGMQSGLYVPLKIFHRTLGCISVESDQPDAFTQEDEHLLTTLAVQVAVAIENARLFQSAQKELAERKRAEEELRQKELEYHSLADNIPDIVARFDPQLRYIYVNDGVEKIMGIPAQSFLGMRNRDLPMPEKLVEMWDDNLSQVFETGRARTIEFEYHSLKGLRRFESRLVPELGSTGEVERVLSIARDITERKQAELRIREQLERLTALSNIDQAIMSSFDLHVTLDVLLSQVVSQLQIDAADVLLLSRDGQQLEYAAGQGFRMHAMESRRVRMGESYAGRAAKERQLIKIENLTREPRDPLFATLLAGEGFVSYYGVPLIAKGKVVGVLEVFCRAELQPYPEWLDFLDTLARQAAIAIENATLLDNLEYSHRELFQAYDATIEGWSRAMDLRDRETEGHTQRVTRMTLELARAMQVDDAQLIHIRRGALLHDMGKLGIPDPILLKAEKLTEEEWEIMRKHPQFAYEMLSSIRYLEPALKIPYCHHEKWDGTGYPRGLKGEQIPLEARIFAVVDVWDALRSDRPYRPAWDHEKARDHIREHAGTDFDPKVVKQFLKIIK